jgi:sugar phosphate permease
MRGHRRYWVFAFLFTVTFINYTDRVALSVAATPIRAEFGLSPVQLGYLMSSFLWIFIFCLLPVGLLVDRFGGKVMNASGIGIWSAATMLTGLSPSLGFMIASRMIMGMGESACWPASNRVIREWFPARERGLANAIFGAGSAAGPALGAMGVSAIVAVWGWRTGFLVAGAAGFIWLVVWQLVFDRPERVGWLSKEECAHIVAHRDGGSPQAVDDVRPASSLWYLLSLRSVWGLFLTQGCEVFGGYMLLTWLPSYLQAAKGLSLLNAGMLTAIPFGAASVMAVLLGKTSDLVLSHDAVHAGRRRIMLAVLMLITSSFVLVPFLDSLWASIPRIPTRRR